MAEHRAPPTGEHRGHSFAVGRDPGVSDRICAAVDEEEAPAAQGSPNRCIRVSKPKHLGVGHNAVLTLGQGRRSMMRSYFIPHSGNKYDLNGVRPVGNICSPL
jgi:hypothetical protein